ncbi:MAG TPA: exodeoxyribonuclease VII small subunit [Bacteroidales bacterium]|nr:exodeoxyribonuclease VII small subunit [Bacteroidales bacterium]HSA42805.1 exodeoxyribonuclease VII small subunit [Bacteroidales bacterium]
MTYQKAWDELNLILSEMEQEQLPLDQLSVKLKRAGELILFCREKLRATEQDFKQQLEMFGKEQNS